MVGASCVEQQTPRTRVLTAPAWRMLSPDELLPKLRPERVSEEQQVTE